MRKFSMMSLSLAAALAFAGVVDGNTIQQSFYSASNISGGLTVSITNDGTPTDALSNTLPGYTAYTMSVSTNKPTAFDVSVVDFGNIQFDANTGFNGPLALEDTYVKRAGTTTYTPVLSSTQTNGSSSSYGLGSHFLFSQSANVAAGGNSDNFTQTTTGSFAGLSNGGYLAFGTGTYLRGATGFYKANEVSTLPLAYLVIPNGQTISYNAQIVLNVAGAGPSNPDTINVNGSIPTPEPTTLGVFGLGAQDCYCLAVAKGPETLINPWM